LLGLKNYGYGEIIITNNEVFHKFINIDDFVEDYNYNKNPRSYYYESKYMKYKQKYLAIKNKI
jgi:hypothetical protein